MRFWALTLQSSPGLSVILLYDLRSQRKCSQSASQGNVLRHKYNIFPSISCLATPRVEKKAGSRVSGTERDCPLFLHEESTKKKKMCVKFIPRFEKTGTCKHNEQAHGAFRVRTLSQNKHNCLVTRISPPFIFYYIVVKP